MRRQQATFVVHIFNINRFSAAVFRCGCAGAFLCTALHNMQQTTWYILNEEWLRS